MTARGLNALLYALAVRGRDGELHLGGLEIALAGPL
jgi:hypothetical protein